MALLACPVLATLFLGWTALSRLFLLMPKVLQVQLRSLDKEIKEFEEEDY
jgi:hypothetical protein